MIIQHKPVSLISERHSVLLSSAPVQVEGTDLNLIEYKVQRFLTLAPIVSARQWKGA
jgi:hypothetical protein